jgi:hypothetical protein
MLTVMVALTFLTSHSRPPNPFPLQLLVGIYVAIALAGIRSRDWREAGYVYTLEEFGVLLLSCAWSFWYDWERWVAVAALVSQVASFFVGRVAGPVPLRGKWLRALLQGIPILASAIPLRLYSDTLAYPANPLLSGSLMWVAILAGVGLVLGQTLSKSSQPVLEP